MNRIAGIVYLIIFFGFTPIVANAAGLLDLINSSYDLVNKLLIPIAFSLCLLYFFWGVAKYIRSSAGSEKAAEEGKRIMIWGIVALFVVSSIWGIVELLRTELGIPNIQDVQIEGN